jgi:hypothetical protein
MEASLASSSIGEVLPATLFGVYSGMKIVSIPPKASSCLLFIVL